MSREFRKPSKIDKSLLRHGQEQATVPKPLTPKPFTPKVPSLTRQPSERIWPPQGVMNMPPQFHFHGMYSLHIYVNNVALWDSPEMPGS